VRYERPASLQNALDSFLVPADYDKSDRTVEVIMLSQSER